MKKIISLLLSVVMTVGMLAGCGGGNSNQTTATKASSENDDTTGTTAPVETVADPMAKYEEPVTLTSFFEIAPTILSTFSEAQLAESYFTKQQHELTNIYIDYLWYAALSAEDSIQKKNVAIASGEIPDFMIVDSAQLSLLAKSDLINTDIYSVFEQYASDTLKEWAYAEGMDALNSASYNGKIIALPRAGCASATASFMWIRQDWLDKLGLEVPKTVEDLYDVMVAFKTQDPDGNGVDDTVGMVAHKDILLPGSADLTGLFNGFGAYPTKWIEDGNGGLIYGSTAPEVKEALVYMAKMYSEGLIEEDFSIKDSTKGAELIAAGTAGIQFGRMWNPMWPLNMAVDNNPEAVWTACAIPTATDEPAKSAVDLDIDGYIVVSKDCEHPEAVIKLLNYWAYTQTASNEEYQKFLEPDASGVMAFPLHFSMIRTWNPNKDINAYHDIKEVMAGNAETSILNAEEMAYYNDIMAYLEGDLSKSGPLKVFGPEDSSYAVMDYYIQSDAFMMNKFTGSNTPTMTQKKSIIEDKVLEYYTKVIMGIEAVDTFDAFVEEVNGLGLANITAEVNEWYAGR